MKKATSKKIAKTVKNLSKKVNRNAKKSPATTVAVAGAVAATSAIGLGTVVTGIIRMPGMIKRRFSKVNLPTDNNDTTTDTTTTTTTDTTTKTDTETTTTTTTEETKEK